MYKVRRCTAGQRNSPYRGFDGFFAGLFITNQTNVSYLDGPNADLMTCQISAKQKDDVNTTKPKIARKH